MGAVRELKKLLQGLKKKTQRTLWQRQTGPRKRSLQGHRAAAQQALREYVPQVYPGRITVVRSSERVPWRLDDRLNGWGQLASEGVEVHEIPGNHTSIYREPNVELLVSTLKKILHHANVRTENEWTAFIDFDESVELMTPGYEDALQT